MKSSEQYKAIAEKYNLSPEHPGLKVSPGFTKLQSDELHDLGLTNVINYPQKILTWGPRFYDKPMNEGCFEKSAALIKYSLMFSKVFWGFDILDSFRKQFLLFGNLNVF